MAPRCSKNRCRGRDPIPLWLPLPRPCLRNMNMPGHPYCMPISPEMYLPPWTIPPSYFTKPMCHCANENFCTTTTCRNSKQCHKMHPMFCPHFDGEETDLQSSVRGQQGNSEDVETSSNSDIDMCSACRAPTSKHRASSKKNNFRDIIDEDVHSRERDHTTESDSSSPEVMVSKKPDGSVNSSCQATFSNTRIREKNSNKRSLDSLTDYPEESETSDRNSKIIPTDTHKTSKNNIKNRFGCGTCAEQNYGPADNLGTYNSNSTPNDRHEIAEIPKKLPENSIHLDQLPDNLSNTRKNQANKYSGCCLPGSEKACVTNREIDALNASNMEIPYKNVSKPRKKSDCECYSSKKPGKASLNSHKLTECICSPTNTHLKGSPRVRKKSKRECSPYKMPHKHMSKSLKLTECECSSTKITQKTNSRKISEHACCSKDMLRKASSKGRKLSENGFPTTEGNPDTNSFKLTTKKSKKALRDIENTSETNVRQSSCQCKFPPAYEHLSCKRNENNNCSCNNNS